MPNSIITPAPQRPSPWADTVKAVLTNLLAAGAIGFISSYLTQTATQQQYNFRLEAQEKQSAALVLQITKIAEAAELNARNVDRMAVRNEVLIEQFAELKREHEELMRRSR